MAIRLAGANANYRFAYPRDAMGWVARLVLSILTVFLAMEALRKILAGFEVMICVSVRSPRLCGGNIMREHTTEAQRIH